MKSYIQKAPLGSVIRISSKYHFDRNNDDWGHSFILVQKDNNGFTVLEGGWKNFPYHAERYFTWKGFANYWKDNFSYDSFFFRFRQFVLFESY